MSRRSAAAPLIGITPDVRLAGKPPRRPEPLLFIQERYTRAVLDAGAVPLVLPVTASRRALGEILDRLDGAIVSGGNFDIHPRLYGERPIPALGQVKEERSEFELELIALALRRDLPLLGICGGAQAINVALGGSLYQDIGTQLSKALDHESGGGARPREHRVKIHEGTRLRRIVERASLKVNTAHHQAAKRLGEGLVVNATAEDGVIEGIESRGHRFVLGVQWHPERLVERDRAQRKLIAAFIAAAKKR